jgi:hypothetical protein
MDKSYPSKTLMVVRSLKIDKDQFRPKGENEEVLGLEVPYLSAIGALMYIANCTRPDIAFAVNLLVDTTLLQHNVIGRVLRISSDIS